MAVEKFDDVEKFLVPKNITLENIPNIFQWRLWPQQPTLMALWLLHGYGSELLWCGVSAMLAAASKCCGVE